MIRIVPGGNVGPGRRLLPGRAVGSATGVSLSDRPRKSAAPTTATRTSSEMPTTHGVRLPRRRTAPAAAPASAGRPGRRRQDRRGLHGDARPRRGGDVGPRRPAPPAHHRRRAVGVGVPPGGGPAALVRSRPTLGRRTATGRPTARVASPAPCPSPPRQPSSAGCAPPGACSPRTRPACSWPRPATGAELDVARRPAGGRRAARARCSAGRSSAGCGSPSRPGVFVPRRRTEVLVGGGGRPGPAGRGRRRPLLRVRRARRRRGRRPWTASSCTPRTSTPPPSPAPGRTSRRSAAGPTRATCSTRCPRRCAGGSTCCSPTCPYVPSDGDRADAAGGPAARGPGGARRRRRTGWTSPGG